MEISSNLVAFSKNTNFTFDLVFSQFASWKRNHNKNSLKKFVDLKFEIGGTIWWIRNWFWFDVFGFWLMQWNKPLTQKDTACKYGGFSTTSRYPGQQGALQMSTDPTLFQPAMQHSNWKFLYGFSSYLYIYIYNFDFFFFFCLNRRLQFWFWYQIPLYAFFQLSICQGIQNRYRG